MENQESETIRRALIVGSTGLVGFGLAEHLVKEGWDVFGVARRQVALEGMTSIQADLLDRDGLQIALKDVHPTHVFFATWSRNDTEADNIRVNGAMMRNLLDALRGQNSIRHFAMVTGLKHYIGPFEIYAQVPAPPTPFRETIPRLDIPNFYYTLEELLFEAAEREGFTWSVHRPHTMIGYAKTNVMNMGTTLGVYAAYVKEMGLPFIFPGNELQWNSLTDVTDSGILAEHLEWAASTPAAHNQALHVVNGDVFRWKWMWPRIAEWFGMEPVGYQNSPRPLAEQMRDARPAWAAIARKYGLIETNLDKIASFWHTDGDLLRPFEVITDMSKSRKLGFTEYKATDQAFFDLFERLREERIIP